MADTETMREDTSLAFYPLTRERWADLVALFGDNGACGGCWCMYWRNLRAVYEAGKGETNRAAFEQLVSEGPPPGVLAYSHGTPIGWCAVAPREKLTRLTQSHILRPLDDQPVWSVSCFFVTPGERKRKVALALLQAAIAFAKAQGGRIVEGYPVEARHTQMPAAFAWTGFASTFLEAGFSECARRSETRPMMRLILSD